MGHKSPELPQILGLAETKYRYVLQCRKSVSTVLLCTELLDYSILAYGFPLYWATGFPCTGLLCTELLDYSVLAYWVPLVLGYSVLSYWTTRYWPTGFPLYWATLTELLDYSVLAYWVPLVLGYWVPLYWATGSSLCWGTGFICTICTGLLDYTVLA